MRDRKEDERKILQSRRKLGVRENKNLQTRWPIEQDSLVALFTFPL